MEYVKIVVYAVAIAGTLIYYLYTLVKNIKAAVEERKWNVVLELLMGFMEEVEPLFEEGTTKKEVVMSKMRNAVEQYGLKVDMEVISQLIDRLCDMSNVVNPPADEGTANA